WNIHDDKTKKGINYIRENVKTLEGAKAEHMTCGFEVVFPSLLQRAEKMGIDGIPYDDPVVRQIQAAREEKLKRIPIEMMHRGPNSLLFSLEGLQENDLNWDRLLKLQSADGSFLTSPSSTAYAFMKTKDEKCYRFIANTLRSCNGGAPHTYPVDVFGRLWAVDRLQRLGISRFFESEISELLRHIYTCWSNKGVFSGRDSEFVDIDDTSMGFRLLRQHGYDVDPVVFMNFKNGNKFSCYGGQIIESSSPIYNLYRACQ
ncbi:copalyl diphosphate synthase, partial [Genlisea aurea]